MACFLYAFFKSSSFTSGATPSWVEGKGGESVHAVVASRLFPAHQVIVFGVNRCHASCKFVERRGEIRRVVGWAVVSGG